MVLTEHNGGTLGLGAPGPGAAAPSPRAPPRAAARPGRPSRPWRGCTPPARAPGGCGGQPRGRARGGRRRAARALCARSRTPHADPGSHEGFKGAMAEVSQGAAWQGRAVRRHVRDRHLAMRTGRDQLLDLDWAPGTAQADSGGAGSRMRGTKVVMSHFAPSLPFSNVGPAQVFPGENAERVRQGLRNVFECLSAVPALIVFDSAAGVGRRVCDVVRTTALLEGCAARCGFDHRFCSPYSGNEEGSVESRVGTRRRNLFVPVPRAWDVAGCNARPLDGCMRMADEEHHIKGGPGSQLFQEDLFATSGLPAAPYSRVRWVTPEADRKGRVRVGGRHWRSTDPSLAGLELPVALGAATVEVHAPDGSPVCTHRRAHGHLGPGAAAGAAGQQARRLGREPGQGGPARRPAGAYGLARGAAPPRVDTPPPGPVRRVRPGGAGRHGARRRGGRGRGAGARTVRLGRVRRGRRPSRSTTPRWGCADGDDGQGRAARRLPRQRPQDDARQRDRGRVPRRRHARRGQVGQLHDRARDGPARAEAQGHLARQARLPSPKATEGGLVFHGRAGRGKTRLARAVGTLAVGAGRPARFFTVARLVLALSRARGGAARGGGARRRQGGARDTRRVRLRAHGPGGCEAALPGDRRLPREEGRDHHHEHRVQQVGHGAGRRQARRRDHRPHRSPRQARGVQRHQPSHGRGADAREELAEEGRHASERTAGTRQSEVSIST